MRISLLYIILLLANAVVGQDTTYFDNDWKELKSSKSMSYYQVFTKDKSDTNQVAVRNYCKSGQILKDQFYISYSKHLLHGKQKYWYESGAFKSEINFDYGKISGQLLTYWENGQIKRKEFYKKKKIKKRRVLEC